MKISFIRHSPTAQEVKPKLTFVEGFQTYWNTNNTGWVLFLQAVDAITYIIMGAGLATYMCYLAWYR